MLPAPTPSTVSSMKTQGVPCSRSENPTAVNGVVVIMMPSTQCPIRVSIASATPSASSPESISTNW